MIREKVEVTQADYLKFKKEVLESDMIVRTDVKMSDLDITDLETVKLRGVTLRLSNNSVKGLGNALGVNKNVIKLFKQGFGEDNVRLLNELLKAIKGKSLSGLTIVYNKPMKLVTSMYPKGTKLMSDSTYFDALESLISKTPGSYLRNISQTVEGDIKSVIANPELKFQFGRLNDESFTSGITFNLTAGLLHSSFFTERLVCSNGMAVNNKLCSRAVSVRSKVPEFLAAITSGQYHLDSIEAFKSRINGCYYSPASLAEVLKVGNRVDSLLGEFAPMLTRPMSIHGIKMRCGEHVLQNRQDEHAYLRTDITLWELVNEITALSSRIEQSRMDISQETNLRLQMLGGDIMFNKPDLSPVNIKQVFPKLIIN